MAKATLADHPTYGEAVDQEALQEAIRRVQEILMKEQNKNANRWWGSSLHVSEVGQ